MDPRIPNEHEPRSLSSEHYYLGNNPYRNGNGKLNSIILGVAAVLLIGIGGFVALGVVDLKADVKALQVQFRDMQDLVRELQQHERNPNR